MKTWDDIVKEVARKLFDGTYGDGDIDPDMIKRIATDLFEVVQGGYGARLGEKGLAGRDVKMLQQMQENIFVFSGFKNEKQLSECSNLLTDDEGEVRTFEDFFADVKAIDETYNKTYARTEYEYALGTAQNIADYQTAQEEKEALPLSEWVTDGGGNCCDACNALDGVILPLDEWTVHPKLHWGCGCKMMQRDSSAGITPASKINLPPPGFIKPMFKHNPGKDGVIFPEQHSYFGGVTKKEAKTITKKSIDLIPPFEEPKEEQPAKEFEPAATVKEAEKWAVDNELAIKVSYKGIDIPEVANAINKALHELKQEHGIVYDEVQTKSMKVNGVANTIMANATTFNVKTKQALNTSLIINKAFFARFENMEDIDAHIKSMRKREWTTGEKLEDLVNHEIGHRLTANKLYAGPKTKTDSPIFDYKQLGRYASSSLEETLAEVYSFYKKTGDAPKEWKALFNKWSDVKIK